MILGGFLCIFRRDLEKACYWGNKRKQTGAVYNVISTYPKQMINSLLNVVIP